MTVKEAIDCIDAVLSADVHYDESIDYLVTSDDIEWLEMAKEALERAEKKKPYDIDIEGQTFDCPNCLSSLWSEDDITEISFCSICGQALDWGDVK